MLRIKEKQQSFYSVLYDKIPKNHLLKSVEKAVDFSFINILLADSYCKDNGRPAKEPEMMGKLLFLQYIYTLSDIDVMDEAAYNLAFLWFLGLNPEDKLPDPSLLAKFRTQRLKEFSLDDIITEIVHQCVENGIIKSSSISIDTTHIEANTIKKVPERIMKHLAKKIFKGLESDIGEVPNQINTNIPDYTLIADHVQAKQVMKQYVEAVIEQATPFAGEQTRDAITEAKDVLSDEKFMLQKGIRSLVDKDARVGNKSKTSQFYGYKDEYIMTTDERIITAVNIHSGEYVDGKDFTNLLERTKQAGIMPTEVYGDKAYFRKDILDTIKENNAEAYIPVSASAYKIDEELLSYNKDSDQWFCNMGNHTILKQRKARNRDGKKYEFLEFTFQKEQCIACPHRAECMGKSKKKARKLRVSLNAHEFYAISQRQRDPAFLEKYKKRAAHEWKNGEMKRFHGLAKARGYGLKSILTQAKLTAIAVNLKRIASIMEKTSVLFWAIINILWNYIKTAFKNNLKCSNIVENA
jgi:transposase